MYDRTKFIGQCNWAFNNEPNIHWDELRPIPIEAIRSHHLPITTDCSGLGTGLFYACGFPDPNGFGYNGQGNTDSLAKNGVLRAVVELEPADYIIFSHINTGITQHVIWVVEPGSDPLCLSHGQEKGPYKAHLSAEDSYFRRIGCKYTSYRSKFLPATPVEVDPMWVIQHGDGTLIGKTRHPRTYAATHDPFRAPHYRQVKFTRYPK